MQIHMYTYTYIIYIYIINVHVTNLPSVDRKQRTPAVGMGQNPGTGSKLQNILDLWMLIPLKLKRTIDTYHCKRLP